jgi:crotonobetainyl-CoA:carnitine CoA-transferase CaiB-like acyl-CoA transferase
VGTGPLEGLRVIDAGNLIAGPMAAAILGDYGAEIIKIEHPERGDPLRDWEPKRDGRSLWWKVTARNKRLITLNLADPRGQQLLLELIRDSDVLVENFRAGTFEDWGLGYDTLAAHNARLVFLRISGFGQTGPYRHKPGYGTIAEAMSGIPYFTGQAGSPPTLPGFPMADSVAAVFGALAVMSAIYQRDHSTDELGQEIDLSLYEPLFRLVESQVIGFDQLGRIKERIGNRLEEDAPRNAYETQDGEWIAISASSNRTWARLAKAIGEPQLAADPRFATSSIRVEHVDDLDRILSDWFKGRSASEAMKRLEDEDVVAGPVLNVAEIFEHEQYRARENIVAVPDDDFGTVRMQAPVPRFLGTPCGLRFAGRERGHDTDAILGGELGLSDQDLGKLRQDKVI